MLSNKRKLGDYGLGRRVRARKEEDSDVEEVESSDAPSEEDANASEDEGSEEERDDEDGSVDDGDTEAGDEQEQRNPALDLSSISFGDLAKAHAAISKQSKKSAPSAAPAKDPPFKKPAPSKAARTELPKRSTKHAPTEMSSKKPVSRKRDIISDTKPKPRDPRFDPVSGPLNEGKLKRAYAFLDSYRDDEIKKLREALRKVKSEDEKEGLKRQLKPLEGRRDTEKKKAEEQRVLEEHKKQEKELVKEGKQPFYLKKAEQKRRFLAERFKKMNKGQVEKAIVKKRKKEATKDRIALEEVERATGARARR